MSGSASLFVNQGFVPNTRGISNQSQPAGNVAKTLPFTATLSSATPITLDLQNSQFRGIIDQVQSVFVDNADNPSSLSITTTTGQRVVCPPNSQAWLPLLSSNPPLFVFASSGGVDVTVFLCNIPMPVDVWATAGASA